MTPFEVEFLLHYYCKAGDIENLSSHSGQEAATKFERMGLIKRNKEWKTLLVNTVEDPNEGCIKYFGNEEALELYVNELCNVPLPVQGWVMKK